MALATLTIRSPDRSISEVRRIAVTMARMSLAIGCCRARIVKQRSSMSRVRASISSSASMSSWASARSMVSRASVPRMIDSVTRAAARMRSRCTSSSCWWNVDRLSGIVALLYRTSAAR